MAASISRKLPSLVRECLSKHHTGSISVLCSSEARHPIPLPRPFHRPATIAVRSQCIQWHHPSTLAFHTSVSHCAKKGKKHKPKVDVSMSADSDILDLEELKKELQKSIDSLKQDYSRSLTLRTTQGALDHIMVPTQDGKVPLNQLGRIVSKSTGMMTVNLSNFPDALEAAAKAISASGMNLNPKIDGSLIQIPIPKVSKEHRENLAKSAKGMCDKAKVNMRSVRSKFISSVRKHKDSVSKDTIFSLEKQIQEVTDSSSSMAEQLLAAKVKELLGK